MTESSERKLDLDLIKRTIVHLLSFLDRFAPFGTELFNAFARVNVTLTVEVIPWRIGPAGTVEILLSRRGQDQSDPGRYHNIGTAIRVGEGDIERDTIARLAKSELGEECRLDSLRFIGNWNHPNEARGHFFSPVYIARIVGEPREGEWWPVDALPSAEEAVADQLYNLWPMAIQAIEQELA